MLTRPALPPACTCIAGFYVLMNATAEAAAASRQPSLPATGIDTVVLAAVGTALVIGGAAALRGASGDGASHRREEREVEEEPMDPDVIASRDFYITVRGYDRAEVRAFLEEVAAHCRRLEGSASPVESPAQSGVTLYEAFGNHVASVLEAAERSADALVQDARERAAAIVAEAREDAERARRDDEQRLEALRRDLDARERELSRATDQVRRRAEELEREAEASRAEATAAAEQIVADARRAAADSYRRRDETLAELTRLWERIGGELSSADAPALIDLRDGAGGVTQNAETTLD